MSPELSPALEPNPNFGKVSLKEKLQCILFLPLVPWTLLQVLFRRLLSKANGLSFKQDFTLAYTRVIQYVAPLSVMRKFGKTSESRLEKSTRFANVKHELYQKAIASEFAGYWICQGAPGHHTPPNQCDLVIYYLHGGGYKTGHPATPLSSFLRVAEIAASSRVSVAVFALNYSLAPETQWGTQIDQSLAGYRYLLSEHNIEPSKISLQGDSAGGHLVLSFFNALADTMLPEPSAGVILVSPWIDLRCSSNGSFVQNKTTDYIIRDIVVEAGYEAIPASLDKELSHIINFLAPRPRGQSWAKILPAKVCVTAGSNEIFADDIYAFAKMLKKDGVDAVFEQTQGKCHVWQFFDDAMDVGKYFQTAGFVPDGLMGGAAKYADTVLSLIKS
ncbi:alpha/beta-hydrolase [Aureobasidium sp. EXF-8845]|nr:alpha/beta-hydrolase [Aureobasidium sp. EXF-8845]KAI4858015.1 alpha/beta-hydrolase [Aureobasidium sp. EXF-8846]